MPTMQDVANKAGVTLSTVSHALSGKPPISEETRARIQQAIEELGYRPNELARRLANKESKILGLFFPKFHTGLSEMQFEFVCAAIDATEKEGYAILLWRSPKDVDSLINLTQEGLVDGVIFMEVRIKDAWVIRLRESGFPFCMIGRTEDNMVLALLTLTVLGQLRMPLITWLAWDTLRLLILTIPRALLRQVMARQYFVGKGPKIPKETPSRSRASPWRCNLPLTKHTGPPGAGSNTYTISH